MKALAIFGGEPRFAIPVHVGRPNIGDRKALLRRIEWALDRHWLTNNGALVQEFERELCRILGVRHCIAVCNGTIALELAVRAMDLSGEVIVPAFTFVATAHALQWQGIRPVFCDIDPRTHHLDPASVERAIGPKTTGIIGVHLWGEPCDIAGLTELATRHGLRLLFDAAHAFGCTHRGRMIGSFGGAEVFSFHATKFVNTLEGGAIATNDDDLATRLRLMRNFGFTGYDRVEHLGINGKMNEASAAMGLTNLESMDRFIAANERNYQAYRRFLAGIPGVELLAHGIADQRNHQYIVLLVDEEAVGLSRDRLMAVMHAENVLARRYFWPGCHRMEPYCSRPEALRESLAQTDAVARRVLVLPTGTAISESDVAAIAGIIRQAVDCAERLMS